MASRPFYSCEFAATGPLTKKEPISGRLGNTPGSPVEPHSSSKCARLVRRRLALLVNTLQTVFLTTIDNYSIMVAKRGNRNEAKLFTLSILVFCMILNYELQNTNAG